MAMSGGWIGILFHRVETNRNLLKNLVVRDLKHRYVGSIGGFVWSFVHPLVLLVSYTFVFSVIFQIRLGAGYGTESFPIYLFCGILPWLMFQDTLVRSCSAITDNAALITKTIIPAEVLPIAITISNLVHHLIGLAILLVVLVLFEGVHLSVFWILLYLPMMLALAQGMGWMLSSLNVFFRDTMQVLNILLIFWFWFTPIFYPADRIPAGFQFLAAINPMAVVVTGYRNALLEIAQPSPFHVLMLLAWSVAFFVAGALFFRQAKPAFGDVL